MYCLVLHFIVFYKWNHTICILWQLNFFTQRYICVVACKSGSFLVTTVEYSMVRLYLTLHSTTKWHLDCCYFCHFSQHYQKHLAHASWLMCTGVCLEYKMRRGIGAPQECVHFIKFYLIKPNWFSRVVMLIIILHLEFHCSGYSRSINARILGQERNTESSLFVLWMEEI